MYKKYIQLKPYSKLISTYEQYCMYFFKNSTTHTMRLSFHYSRNKTAEDKYKFGLNGVHTPYIMEQFTKLEG